MIVKNHLIIFSKTPRYSIVKKRLAKDIGNIEALRFYANSLRKNLRNLGQDPRWGTWLALSSKRDKIRKDKFWGCKFFFQGHGDIGNKMKNCINTVPGGNTILIGGDIPNIGRETISNAFKKLEFYDLVFGPSFDGGFWLVGVKGDLNLRRRNTFNIFNSVRWSSKFTLDDTMKNIRNKKVYLLNYKSDIDTIDDLNTNQFKNFQYNRAA